MSEQWSNAPVFYALAQVQFNAIAAQKFADDVQQAFRDAGYPDAQTENAFVLDVAPVSGDSPPEVRHSATVRRSYMNTRRTEGFVWLANSLVYHTTEYQTFEVFKQRFRTGLETLSAITKPDFVTRVGARYLDLVLPKESEKLSKFLKPQMLGLSDLLVDQGHTLNETVIRTLPSTLISRVFIANFSTPQSTPPVPNEILPLQLKMKSAFQGISGKMAVIDTDCFKLMERERFDIDFLEACLTEVKAGIQGVFDAAITDSAREAWR